MSFSHPVKNVGFLYELLVGKKITDVFKFFSYCCVFLVIFYHNDVARVTEDQAGWRKFGD